MMNAANPVAYDQALAARLVPLTSLANQTMKNLMLPDDWALLYQYTASTSFGGSQYFFAAYPANNPTVCVLVLGAEWSKFISFYVPFVNHVLQAVNPAIVGGNEQIQADTGFNNMYKALRKQIWLDIAKIQQSVQQFASQLPMITVGIGPGAALAQLAAIDLRPGKSHDASTVTQIQSYVYSCPPFGDAAFAQFLSNKVAASFRVQALADAFPNQPAVGSGYINAGQLQALPYKIPTYDTPWVLRDAPYYQQQLAASEISVDSAGSYDTPAGFSPLVAFSMAQLSSVPYQMALQPGSSLLFNNSYGNPKTNVNIQGSIWASIFEGPDNLAIALRGTLTWQELFTLISDAFPGSPDWISSDFGQYANQLVLLYQAGRDALRAALNDAKLGDKPIILTGHDCGGALANLMAVDLLQHPLNGQRRVQSIYTFGATPAADAAFATSFDLTPLNNINFQVVRPRDVMPNLRLLGFLQTLGTKVELSGGDFDSYNGSTWHGIYNYINLLNPQS